MTTNGDSFPDKLLTIGDVLRKASFVGYSRRQLEYALERGRIRPIGRVGIIRIYSVDQLPQILEAVRRTTRRGSRRPEVKESTSRQDRSSD